MYRVCSVQGGGVQGVQCAVDAGDGVQSVQRVWCSTACTGGCGIYFLCLFSQLFPFES